MVTKANTNAKEMYNELQIQAKLKHENVVRFFEIFDEPQHYHVVMELITGGELFDRIIELRRYTEKDASHVMRQVLLGLKHMHDQHIVHRDLKPENLLLSSKELNATVKLADFGFSVFCAPNAELFETLGTPPYMAPELVVLRNDDEDLPGYGKGVDVWAIGICLYILLSGIHPFQIEDEDLMLDNIEEGKWRWLGPNWNSISPEAKDLISHMMNPDPQTRFTVDQCLNSAWMKGHAPDIELDTIKDEIKSFQAKKRLKGAIFSVLATNKLANMMASLNAQKLSQSRPAGATPSAALDVPKNNQIKTQKQRTVIATNTDFQTLKVHLIGGRDLAAKDANGKSDPYVRVWCGAFKYKSKTIKKSLNPVWDEHIEIPASYAKANPIDVECWDWDVVGGDDYMGEFSFKSDIVPSTGELRKAFPLHKPNQKSKRKEGEVSGTIELSLEKI
eukprot:TRINITY_DN656_c0_g1_i19.p1 TRINITY_DN656_c0_g1~~TRINITY_DN656_c0_g1_i19.p1  ORF type:complete len:447 (+),score=70.01 TRINITY_DN656_c0_g1_i19:324-1664(+)